MNEAEVIEIMREYLATQFPKVCKCCGRQYNSLAQYLRETRHLGKPLSYDADIGDWQPKKPMGTLSMATCSCGTTLAISSAGMDLNTLLRLMNWAREETQSRGIGLSDVLEDLRAKIDQAVLQDEKLNEPLTTGCCGGPAVSLSRSKVNQ
jgi:hypothetical protein